MLHSKGVYFFTIKSAFLIKKISNIWEYFYYILVGKAFLHNTGKLKPSIRAKYKSEPSITEEKECHLNTFLIREILSATVFWFVFIHKKIKFKQSSWEPQSQTVQAWTEKWNRVKGLCLATHPVLRISEQPCPPPALRSMYTFTTSHKLTPHSSMPC